MVICLFFFFKQKTAYEMRISDWSSDVCSSDLPKVIGVVTSPTGAVIRDILHRLEDRCPTHVVLWPVQVQGPGAAAQIGGAIRGFDALETGGAVPRPDPLILGGGGGSLAVLWGFIKEVVAHGGESSRERRGQHG